MAKRFLLTGVSDESEATFFQGVHQVEPATSLVMSLREGHPSLSATRYWEPTAQPGAATPADAANVRETLEEAVRVHLRSDVAIGTCLSGGIDSTGIVALCDQLRRRGTIPQYSHHAFGYVPPSPEYSEENFMRDAADHCDVELEIVRPSPREFDTALLDIVRQQDEPFGSLSIAAQYFVFQAAAARGIKVMLDGQGADEVFGGYHSYLSAKGSQLLRRRRAIAYLRYAVAHQRAYGRPPVPWSDVARAGIRRVRALRRDAALSKRLSAASLRGPAGRLPLAPTASGDASRAARLPDHRGEAALAAAVRGSQLDGPQRRRAASRISTIASSTSHSRCRRSARSTA